MVKTYEFPQLEYSVADNGLGVTRDFFYNRSILLQITESSEPVDVRKNRQLTLDNMKLQREVTQSF
jgi:hypothetical protein